jgi:hypothetical protein
MRTSKQHKVVMLPTNEKANFACGLQPNGVLKYCNSINALGIGKPQHLYIISDDEIKEGDWFYGYGNKIIGQAVKNDVINVFPDYLMEYKKIITTTDNSINVNYPIKEIPESFIQAYIKAYNEGKPITEVDLEILSLDEWKAINKGKPYSDFETNTFIKTRPDNTVIVHQSKMYSRDEVVKLCQQAYTHGLVDVDSPIDIDEWIQDNL